MSACDTIFNNIFEFSECEEDNETTDHNQVFETKFDEIKHNIKLKALKKGMKTILRKLIGK